MADTLDPKNVDKRIWERYVRNGQLDEKAYEKFIKGLPDVADKAMSIDTAMADDDFDLDDDDDDDLSDEEDDASEGENGVP